MEEIHKKKRSCWKQRTQLEKCFVALLILFIITIISLVFAITSRSVATKTEQIAEGNSDQNINKPTYGAYTLTKGEICVTPQCVKSAVSILESIDTTVDPCENFYRFACGNYIKNSVIPDDKPLVTTFTVISDKVQQQLRFVLEETSNENETRAIKMVKNYYKSCINKDKINKYGLKIWKNILVKVGGWPILDGASWNDGDFNWKNLMYKFNKIGLNTDYFFQIGVGTDLKNTTIRCIQLDQAEFGISRDFLIQGHEDKFVKAYLKFMVDVAVEMGCDRTTAETEFKESLDFEIQLAKMSMSKEERRDINKLYNLMTIAELQEKYSDIPWLEYINTMIYPESPVDSSEMLIVASPRYISSMINLINQTPKRVQANYAMWRAVSEQIAYLTDNLIQHQLSFHHTLIGITEKQSRWKECVDEVTQALPMLASALYIRRYFDSNARNGAFEMVNYIKDSFNQILKSLDWMDEKTRTSALEKAALLNSHIGYPDELLDNNKLEEYYKTLQIYSGQYLTSHLNIQIHSTSVDNQRLRVPVNKTDWTEHSYVAQVNAFYNPLENSIMVPAGILQGLYFNKDRPWYMNFAAIGSVIGHEITHGFDDTGRQFDKDGVLTDWWEQSTKDLFLQKTQCIIDQYSNYTVIEANEKIDGFNTQGENIADNGGIKEAYLAYKLWVNNNGPESMLPGLVYTPDQLFWISGALNWCSTYRPELYTWLIATDVHSINEFRVVGPFSNLKEFALDFNCAPGSNMNPSNKCTVW